MLAKRFSAMMCVLCLILLATDEKWQRPSIGAPQSMRLYPLAGLASEQEDVRLRAACQSVIPFWRYRRLSDGLHALRLFGPHAYFEKAPHVHDVGEDVELLSSSELFGYLTHPQSYQDVSGASVPPYCFGFGEIVERQGDSPSLPAHRDDILAVLAELSRKVEMHQDISGFYRPWDADWEALSSVEKFHRAILFTGHTLEWMALVDDPWRCGRESLRRAYRWGLWAIDVQDASRSHLGFLYAPNSHLVRALCLIRGVHPVDAVAGN